MHELLQNIRTRCRMHMDGMASASMREKGLKYKLNFGIRIPQIKVIASQYTPNKQLAEALWSEETRELKILASLLYPVAEINLSTANAWARQIPNQEIREQVVFNLFQHMDDAVFLAQTLTVNSIEDLRATGYYLMTRLILSKKISSADFNSFSWLQRDLVSENALLRNAATALVKNLIRLSRSSAKSILEKLCHMKDSDCSVEKEVYDTVAFEFEYLYE